MVLLCNGHAVLGVLVDVVVGMYAHLVLHGSEALNGGAPSGRPGALSHAFEAATGALHVLRARHREVERRATHTCAPAMIARE